MTQMLLDEAPTSEPVEQTGVAYGRGMEGSARAGQKWTLEERAKVDEAIYECALELREFTADDIWKRVPDVPITKGLAGRLNAAKNLGVIRSTGRVTFAQRGGDHDHRQRLAVWESTVFAEEDA